MEARRLLASLAPIANLSVPAQQGYALPLDGGGSADAQTYSITRTSGSSDITASIPQAEFWTINVQYTDPTNAANDFSGPLVFELFPGLTPNTVAQIEQYTNDGYYTNKDFPRVTAGFPGSTNYIVQGGATNANPQGASGQPGTPFLNENVQQLAFTGTYQIAMANGGVNPLLPNYTQGVNTNDAQFFITTTGSPNSELGYGYTIFGQLVSGQATLTKMTQVPVVADSALGGEVSLPKYPIVMSSLSLSATNPDGVALIDTTQARPGDTATFQVTATDPTDGTSVSQSFTVTAGTYSGPFDPAVDFKPLANPGTATVAEGGSTTVTVTGQDGYPDPAGPGTLTYALVTPPSHGTVSNFNASTGTFVYTPQPNYAGPDSLQFTVQDNGPTPPIGSYGGQELFGPATITTSAPTTVAIMVTPSPTSTTPTITWPNPADISYGTALSPTQLDATASVPGTFTYSPAAGTVLSAGAGQVLSVTFTPDDTTDDSSTSATALITVNKAAPTITWTAPAGITYGTALSSTQLDATASVPGTFIYTPALGAVLAAGTDTLSVTFTPTDAVDYATVTATTTLAVAQASPTITWPSPSAIGYGTALSSSQLDATASVPGTFTYSPALGAVPGAGTDTLSVTFTPTDAVDYKTVTKTTTLAVAQAKPTVHWANPSAIGYGTALSSSQLDATASVPGTFTYSPPLGTVLGAGAGQVLSVTFAPSDSADYTSASVAVMIDVLTPAPIPTPTPSPTSSPTTPTSTPPAVTGSQDVTNRKHQVTAVNLTLSGTVDPAAAANKANYQLIKQGKRGVFIASRTTTIKIKSASFNASTGTVTLIPQKPFVLSKPVEVLIVSGPQSGLHHTLVRPLVNPGWPALDPAAILSRGGATPAVATTPAAIAAADAVDVLLAQSDSDGLVHTRAAAWLRRGR
jgi:cyclophilin family peptidyl-prolyl cis-trans isomerase